MSECRIYFYDTEINIQMLLSHVKQNKQGIAQAILVY